MNSLKKETMDLKKQILVALGIDKEETKLGFQAKSDDGTIFVSTAEELETVSIFRYSPKMARQYLYQQELIN